MTIPRAELCAAHLLSKVMIEMRKVFEVPENLCKLYADSMIVLHWIVNIPTHAKMYVANRVADTIENSKGIEWHHVISPDNSADIASRGLNPAELMENRLWWQGPEWLQQPANTVNVKKIVVTEKEQDESEKEMMPTVMPYLSTFALDDFLTINGKELVVR